MSKFVSLSREYFLDNSNIGNLFNLITPYYNLKTKENKRIYSKESFVNLNNCILLDVSIKKNSIVPESVSFLSSNGNKLILSMKNLPSIKIEIIRE